MRDLDICHAFGAAVRNRRTFKKMSQEALAEKAGLHSTYVGLIERGKRTPTLRAAQALAKALGMPLSKLIVSAELNQFAEK